MKLKKQLNLKKIIKEIKKNKGNFHKYSVKKIGLFGSFIKNKHNKESDIDILVKFNDVRFDNYIGLKIMLERLFSRKIDLIIEEDLRPELKQVKKEAKYVKI